MSESFPDELKLAEVDPVYKKNDKKDKSNYRIYRIFIEYIKKIREIYPNATK